VVLLLQHLIVFSDLIICSVEVRPFRKSDTVVSVIFSLRDEMITSSIFSFVLFFCSFTVALLLPFVIVLSVKALVLLKA